MRGVDRLGRLVIIVPLLLGLLSTRSARAQVDPAVLATVEPAAVQIVALVFATENGQISEEQIALGSGTIVSPDGLVLTNHHVVDLEPVRARKRQEEAAFKRQGRVRTFQVQDAYLVLGADFNRSAEWSYVAEIAMDAPHLDLAVLRITAGNRGQPLRGALNLTFVALGDSNDLTRGQPIHIFGYPGVTGEEVVYSDGTVSAFQAEVGILGYAWIVSNATVSGGNSGGTAVDDGGRLIGVPTLATELECRDQGDGACRPSGGSFTRLRPVNLAKPLLDGLSPFFAGSPVPVTTPGPNPTTTREPSPALMTPTLIPTTAPTPPPTGSPAPAGPPGTESRDDFSDPSRGMMSTEPSDPEIYRLAYEGSEYVMATTDPNYAGSVYEYVPNWYTDVTIAVDARLVGEVTGRYIALGCRDGEGATGEYRLDVEPEAAAFWLSAWDGTQWITLRQGTRRDTIRTGQDANRLELSCIGGTIAARINGVLVAERQDDRFQTGRVYLLTGITEANLPGTVETRFDDLVVRVEPPAPPTAPGSGTDDPRDDFTNAARGVMPTESDDPAHFRVAYDNGEYLVAKTDPAFDRSAFAYLTGTYADAALAVDVRIVGDVDGRFAKVGCRNSAQGGYQLVVMPATGTYLLERWNGTAWVSLVSEASAAIKTGTAFNRLELSCVGTTIGVRINEVEVASVDDNHAADGTFFIAAGVLSDRLPGTVEARFDNLAVETPPEGEGTTPGSPTAVPPPSPTPTLTPTVTPAPTTSARGGDLFDDFANPATGVLSRGVTTSTIRLGYEDGEYVMATRDPDVDVAASVSVVGSYGDAAIAVDVRLRGEADGRFVSVICRGTPEAGYRLLVAPAQGAYSLERWDGTAWVSLAVEVVDAVHRGTRTNRLELTCVGTTISARINEVEVASVEDDHFAEGAFGISVGVFQDNMPGLVDARLDNLRVDVKESA